MIVPLLLVVVEGIVSGNNPAIPEPLLSPFNTGNIRCMSNWSNRSPRKLSLVTGNVAKPLVAA